jgi:hypothetical protein
LRRAVENAHITRHKRLPQNITGVPAATLKAAPELAALRPQYQYAGSDWQALVDELFYLSN